MALVKAWESKASLRRPGYFGFTFLQILIEIPWADRRDRQVAKSCRQALHLCGIVDLGLGSLRGYYFERVAFQELAKVAHIARDLQTLGPRFV